MRIDLITRADEADESIEVLREAIAKWRLAGHVVRPRATFEPGDARRFASAARRVDLLVVCGGDGTLNEVANGLVRRGRRPRLAIVPTGTANDFAAGLELPEERSDCLEIALSGVARAVDIAQVNGRAFFNVSVGGMGVIATRDSSAVEKKFLGPLAYLLRGAREVADAAPQPGRFSTDGEVVHDGEFMFFAVGNGSVTGGGTRVAPAADPGDGMLDLVVVRGISKAELVRLLPAIRSGDHLDDPAVVYRQARRIDVRATDALSVNVDGEPLGGGTRLRYRATGEQIEVMVR